MAIDGSIEAGRDTTTQRAALTLADALLLPIPPRGPDIWTLEKVAVLLDEVRTVNPDLRAWAFLNRADATGRDNDEAIGIIREIDSIELIAPRIGDRKAFPSAHTQGLAVFETRPRDLKATAELDELYRYCFGIEQVHEWYGVCTMTVRRPGRKPTPADIERVIEAGGKPATALQRRREGEPVRFQMVVPPELCTAIDGARSLARVSRRAWLLEAAEERLRREGHL